MNNNFSYLGSIYAENLYAHPTFAGRTKAINSTNLFNTPFDRFYSANDKNYPNPSGLNTSASFSYANNYVIGEFTVYYPETYTDDRNVSSSNPNGTNYINNQCNMRRYLFDNGNSEIINLSELYATDFLSYGTAYGEGDNLIPSIYYDLGWFVSPNSSGNIIDIYLNSEDSNSSDKGSTYYLPCYYGINIPILRIFCENVTFRNVDSSLGWLCWVDSNGSTSYRYDHITNLGNTQQVTVCLPRFESTTSVVRISPYDSTVATSRWNSDGTPEGVTTDYRPKRSNLSTEYIISNSYTIQVYDVDLPYSINSMGTTEGVDSYGNPTYEYWSNWIYSETGYRYQTTSY